MSENFFNPKIIADIKIKRIAEVSFGRDFIKIKTEIRSTEA
jgi:hypothetical protein